jgi:mandelate racemase
LCHALDDEGLSWFEKPLDYNRLRGLAQLTHAVRPSVQIKDFHGPREVWRAVDAVPATWSCPI